MTAGGGRPSSPAARPDGVRQLAALLAPEGPRAATPATSEAWDPILAVASRHHLTPALWSALRAAGTIEAVPEPLVDFVTAGGGPGRRLPVPLALARSHRANATHITDLTEQSADLLDAFTAAGIRAVPLKGIDAVWSGRYPDPAARTMVDVDLLVEPAQAGGAADVATSLGYLPAPAPTPSAHQLDPLVRAGRAGSVELHRALVIDRWSGVADPDAVLNRSRPADGRLRMSRTDAAIHLIAHAALHDEAYALWLLPLRCLHETALLIAGPEEVDWDRVVGAFDAVGRRRAVVTHLALTRHLFGVPSPLGAGDRRGALRARGTVILERHPSVRRRLDQVIWVPRALAAGRMAELYGAGDRRSLVLARLKHCARAARRH